MKKSASFLFFALLVTLTTWAQSIQEGINHLNAERYTSARTTFEKMVAANPNNIDATYWLGQTHLASNNTDAARTLYQKALASNGNAPLVLVGMGHVDLLDGRSSEARQRFETAISLSRGKKGDDPIVLNAIGRANVESKNGDVAYAIAKLTDASKLAPNNPDIFINLGNAYRKAREGGQAVTNYLIAARLNPASGLPYYRMARIYETQRNWDIFNTNLEAAIKADPRFAPAFLSQYFYNLLYKKDFAAAEELARKFIAVTDPSPQNEYFRAQTLYLQKNYDEAISIGKNILTQAGDQANASLYRLLAYSYMAKGDTSTAKEYVDQLFTKAKEEDRVAQDYSLKADIYSKDYPEQVIGIYLDAASNDTTLRNKMLILQEALEWARTNNRKIPEGDIRLAMYRLNPSPNPAALFQIGLPYYQGGAYQRADSVFQAYSAAFPDSTFGYLWSARSLGRIDSTMSQGLAIPAYEKLLEVSEKDKVKNRATGVEASANLASYYVNVKGDKEKGILYLSKALEFDPNNEAFKRNLEILRRPAPAAKPATPKKKPATKGATPKKKN